MRRAATVGSAMPDDVHRRSCGWAGTRTVVVAVMAVHAVSAMADVATMTVYAANDTGMWHWRAAATWRRV